MSKTIIKVPATISKVSSMADRGVRIQADTQELNPTDAGIIMTLSHKLGWLLFSEQEIKEEDIKDLPDIQIERGEKTPSQRLRARMFVYYVESLKRDKNYFNDWYAAELNRIGEKYLEKLK